MRLCFLLECDVIQLQVLKQRPELSTFVSPAGFVSKVSMLRHYRAHPIIVMLEMYRHEGVLLVVFCSQSAS